MCCRHVAPSLAHVSRCSRLMRLLKVLGSAVLPSLPVAPVLAAPPSLTSHLLRVCIMIRVVALRLAQTRRPTAPGVTRYRLSKRVPCMWMVQTLPMAMPHALMRLPRRVRILPRGPTHPFLCVRALLPCRGRRYGMTRAANANGCSTCPLFSHIRAIACIHAQCLPHLTGRGILLGMGEGSGSLFLLTLSPVRVFCSRILSRALLRCPSRAVHTLGRSLVPPTRLSPV